MFSHSSSPEITTVQLDLGSGKKSKSDQKATTPSLAKKQSSSKTSGSKSPGSSGSDSVAGKAAVASMLGSPKPKRTLFDGFKQTLRGKNYEGTGKEKENASGTNSAVGSPTSDTTPAMSESYVAGVGNNSRRNSDDNLPVSER